MFGFPPQINCMHAWPFLWTHFTRGTHCNWRHFPNKSFCILVLHLCSPARPSCTGTPVRVWMRWSSLRPSPTWMIWSLSTSSTKMLLLKRRVNSTRRRANMTDEPGHEEIVSGNSGQFSPASLDIADNWVIKQKRPKRAAVWPDHPSCKSRQDNTLKNLNGSSKKLLEEILCSCRHTLSFCCTFCRPVLLKLMFF